MTTQPPDSLILGRYRLGKRIAEGAQGTIYHAQDEQLDRKVAVQVIAYGRTDDPVLVERFKTELQKYTQMNQATIVPVYDYAVADDNYYVITGLPAEGTLHDRIHDGKLEPYEIGEVLHSVTQALENLHRHGIVYGDLKPSNVWFDEYNTPMLAVHTAALNDVFRPLTEKETAGGVIGNPSYMAPEQVEGKTTGPATDQYSLAALIYEMLTGEPPVTGASPIEVLMTKLMKPPPSLNAHGGQFPAELDDAVKRALAIKPDERFGEIGEFAWAVERIINPPEQAMRGSAPEPASPRAGVQPDVDTISPDELQAEQQKKARGEADRNGDGEVVFGDAEPISPDEQEKAGLGGLLGRIFGKSKKSEHSAPETGAEEAETKSEEVTGTVPVAGEPPAEKPVPPLPEPETGKYPMPGGEGRPPRPTDTQEAAPPSVLDEDTEEILPISSATTEEPTRPVPKPTQSYGGIGTRPLPPLETLETEGDFEDTASTRPLDHLEDEEFGGATPTPGDILVTKELDMPHPPWRGTDKSQTPGDTQEVVVRTDEDDVFADKFYRRGKSTNTTIAHFTAFYPRNAQPKQEYGLFVYAHAVDKLPAILQNVEQFREQLGGMIPKPSTAKESARLRHGTPITILLEADYEGLTFAPVAVTHRWNGEYVRFDFKFTADERLVDETLTIRVSVQIAGGVEIAALDCTIAVAAPDAIADEPTDTRPVNPLAAAKFQSQTTRMYQRIFISYSRQDTAVAQMYRLAQIAAGNEVFMDSESLRAGENWQGALAHAIDEADIMQLFWSEHSAASPNVRDEWDYALNHRCADSRCEGFIRPVY